MAFFARPNLDNEQFKQLPDSILDLSGQTRIATISGLTLSDGASSNIVVTARGALTQAGDVLTSDGAGNICLMPVGAGGNVIYNEASPTTCAVGGLDLGSNISGCTVNNILRRILVPILSPSIALPSSTFSISPSDTTYEVGCQITITGNATFNRGSVSPQYCGTSPFRSGLPTAYLYTYYGSSLAPVVSSSLSNSCAAPLHTIIAGANNILSGWVAYASGTTAVLNSTGGISCAALPSGTTAPAVQRIITGIYPYFYGKVASCGASAGGNRPTPTCAMIIAGNKVVADSSGTVSINFNSTSDDYVWFATPSTSAAKTCWFINSLNNGCIGGAISAGGNLFPSLACVTPVTTTRWSGQVYNVYVSNYQSAASLLMELRNS